MFSCHATDSFGVHLICSRPASAHVELFFGIAMGNNFRKIMGARGDSTEIGHPREANTCFCRFDNVETAKGDWPEQTVARNVEQSLPIGEKKIGIPAQRPSCLCGKGSTEPNDCIACTAARRLRELLELSKDEEATKLPEPSNQRSSLSPREAAGEHPLSPKAMSDSLEESKYDQSTSTKKKKKEKGLYERLESWKSFCISGDCMERRRRTARCACGQAGIYTYVIHS